MPEQATKIGDPGFQWPAFALAIPEETLQRIERYMLRGEIDNDFIQALMDNDLRGAVFNASDRERRHLRELVLLLEAYASDDKAWGTPGRRVVWQGLGGLHGRVSKAAGRAQMLENDLRINDLTPLSHRATA